MAIGRLITSKFGKASRLQRREAANATVLLVSAFSDRPRLQTGSHEKHGRLAQGERSPAT
jgi:hypothetical protein